MARLGINQKTDQIKRMVRGREFTLDKRVKRCRGSTFETISVKREDIYVCRIGGSDYGMV